MAPRCAEAVAAGVTMAHGSIPGPEAFVAMRANSVDYAVMENTTHAAMVPAAMGWSDIGNWARARRCACGQAIRQGNAISGSAELIDCRNVLVASATARAFR